MISYIKGTLEQVTESHIVVEANGIGYQITASTSMLTRLPSIGTTVKIYIYMSVREDQIALFGFLTQDENKIFNMLITVNGIGPKTALGIVSSMPPEKIILSIVTEDSATLAKAPGIGKKTALRIILECKDKLKGMRSDDGDTDAALLSPISTTRSEKTDAIEALMVLGYTQSEATRAILSVYDEAHTAESLIKLALKKLV